jgi:dTDP-4-dehydrorhamnose reductase
LTRADLDICDAAQVAAAGDRLRPQVVINCASYNAVDEAEANPDAAFALNARGPALLASVARAHDAVLIHYSTDFVFDGEAVEPYSEHAPTNPLSVYGRSKLAGEHGAGCAPRHYILRLASLFGGVGIRAHRATVDRIADNLLSGARVRAFVDRTVSPSFAIDVAWATRALVERDDVPSGTYHCVSSGFTTWYNLANEMALQLRPSADVEPSAAGQGPGARRPRFCALSNRRLARLGIEMPTWQSAVARHLSARCVEAPAGTSLVCEI